MSSSNLFLSNVDLQKKYHGCCFVSLSCQRSLKSEKVSFPLNNTLLIFVLLFSLISKLRLRANSFPLPPKSVIFSFGITNFDWISIFKNPFSAYSFFISSSALFNVFILIRCPSDKTTLH